MLGLVFAWFVAGYLFVNFGFYNSVASFFCFCCCGCYFVSCIATVCLLFVRMLLCCLFNFAACIIDVICYWRFLIWCYVFAGFGLFVCGLLLWF